MDLISAYPQDNPSSWFNFRIVLSEPVSDGQIVTSSTSCNTGSQDVIATGVYNVGVSLPSHEWEISASVQA